MWMSLMQSVEGLSRTKSPAFTSKRKFSKRVALEFICTIGFLGSPGFWPLEWKFTINFPGSQAYGPTLQVLTCQSPYLCDPISYDESLCVCGCVCISSVSLFLWRALTNTVRYSSTDQLHQLFISRHTELWILYLLISKTTWKLITRVDMLFYQYLVYLPLFEFLQDPEKAHVWMVMIVPGNPTPLAQRWTRGG